MRKAAKIDRNQTEIVTALRAIGATVQSLAAIGKGCPDLLIGFGGKNFLMEIKDGEAVLSKQKLTLDQAGWHLQWRGSVHVVKSEYEALKILQRINDDI
jgi:hypothetical protein